MYREKIRDYYENLSPSYRKVADYIMSHYYEVAFMTAAQLAHEVGIDTTTVVRFSQRLGYNGYPELLKDIRAQVKNEIYAVYEPQSFAESDPASLFQAHIEQDIRHLQQVLTQNPPDHLQEVATLWHDADVIYFVAEGYANAITKLIASQLRQHGVRAEAVAEDPVRRASALARLSASDLVVGVCASEFGESVARALDFAKTLGCATLGVVGNLDSAINRVADRVLYAVSDLSGLLSSTVALTAVLSSFAEMMLQHQRPVDAQRRAISEVYHFLTHRQEDAGQASSK